MELGRDHLKILQMETRLRTKKLLSHGLHLPPPISFGRGSW